MTTIDARVAVGADDGTETATGNVSAINGTFNTDQTGEWAAFRVPVTIPDGATIEVAYLTLRFDNATEDEPQITIYGEKSATPAAYVTGTATFTISSRARTTASVAWSSTDLVAPGSFNSPSILSIINELMGSYSYASGAYMAFLWTSTSGTATRDATVTFYEGSAVNAPLLHIEYTVGGAPYTLPASQGSLALTGQTTGLWAARWLMLAQGGYTSSGQTAHLWAARLMPAVQGSYPLTGAAVTLTYTPIGGYTLLAESATYALAGQEVTLTYTPAGGYLLTAEGAPYALVGSEAAFLLDLLLTAAQGSYLLAGQTVRLVWSGEEAPVTPDSRLSPVAAQERLFAVPAQERIYALIPQERELVA